VRARARSADFLAIPMDIVGYLQGMAAFCKSFLVILIEKIIFRVVQSSAPR
jgi:hypothetical protein